MTRDYLKLLFALTACVFASNSQSQDYIEEIVVTSPNLSWSGDLYDFQRYIQSIDDRPRPGDGIAGDIDELERLCEAGAKKERAKCEAQTLARTVGLVEQECVPLLGRADTETTFTATIRTITGQTRVTTARGIELYDRCVSRANQREQALLKVCENIERNANCEFPH